MQCTFFFLLKNNFLKHKIIEYRSRKISSTTDKKWLFSFCLYSSLLVNHPSESLKVNEKLNSALLCLSVIRDYQFGWSVVYTVHLEFSFRSRMSSGKFKPALIIRGVRKTSYWLVIKFGTMVHKIYSSGNYSPHFEQ